MKSALTGTFVIIIIVTTFIIVSSIQSNTNKSSEIDTALNNAMYATEQDWLHSKLTDDDDYLNKLTANLSKQLSKGKNISYSLEVYGIDYEKGFLDIGLTCSYKNPLDEDKEVYTRKTILIDKTT